MNSDSPAYKMNLRENFPVVSVIITTRNEAVNIGNCLEAIKRQDYPADRMELIVVDNNSTDNTRQIAARYGAKILNFGPERSAQRNQGIRNSIGKYVIYLDADMVLSEHVISECVAQSDQEGLAAIYIPERIMGQGFWIKVRDFERSFYNGTCIDCVRFVRRDIFDQISGFDETLTGPEDWDFDHRVRAQGKTGIIRSPLYHNEQVIRFGKYIGKKMYYARSFENYINKWGVADPEVRKQLGWYYRYWKVFTEDGKWKRLIIYPHLAMAMYFLKIILGLKYLVVRRDPQ